MLDDLDMRIYRADLSNTNIAKNKVKKCITSKLSFSFYNQNANCDFISAIYMSNSSFIEEGLNKITRNRDNEINRVVTGITYLETEIKDKIKNKEKELSLNSRW